MAVSAFASTTPTGEDGAAAELKVLSRAISRTVPPEVQKYRDMRRQVDAEYAELKMNSVEYSIRADERFDTLDADKQRLLKQYNKAIGGAWAIYQANNMNSSRSTNSPAGSGAAAAVSGAGTAVDSSSLLSVAMGAAMVALGAAVF